MSRQPTGPAAGAESTAEEVRRQFEDTRTDAESALARPVEGVQDRAETAGAEILSVRDVMTHSPAAVEKDAFAVDAARAMTAEDVGSLPVVDGERLVGMVTDRDLVVNVMAKGLDATKVPVAECCSEEPVVVYPSESLDTALQRMAQAQVRRLPVVENDRLVGIVAQADIARAAQPAATGEMLQEISRG